MNKAGELFEFLLGAALFGLYGLVSIGGIYWLWMSFQFGSFVMFLVGLVPFFWIVTGPVGGYSLLFGPPDWLSSMFG